MERRGRRCIPVLDEPQETRILETERESTRQHTVENSFWKMWTCRKTDYRMMNSTSHDANYSIRHHFSINWSILGKSGTQY